MELKSIQIRSALPGIGRRKERNTMTTSNVPARIPERQPEQAGNATSRQVVWREQKKPSRFVIKIGGAIPC
jgi:hypothetical protein